MEGWIKLHRKFINWQWATSSNHVALFICLLMRANYKQTKWRTETIGPGQILTGRKQLSTWTGLSERQVRTVLKDLKISGEIDQRTSRHYSIITITKWLDYQVDDQPTTSWRPASDQLTTTSKKANKANKEKNTYTDAEVWVDLFNDAVGGRFKATPRVCSQVKKLVALGYGQDEARTVIQFFKSKWFLDEKMRQYLQPVTLFNEKFPERLDMANNAESIAKHSQFERISKELDLE